MTTKKRTKAKRTTKVRLPARVYAVRCYDSLSVWHLAKDVDALVHMYHKQGYRAEVVVYVRERKRRSAGADAVACRQSMRAMKAAAKRGSNMMGGISERERDHA